MAVLPWAGMVVALSERQMKIIEFIRAYGSVKTSDLVSLHHISRQAALRELAQMVEKGLITRQGIRSGAQYVMR